MAERREPEAQESYRDEVYNILPVQDMLADHDALRFLEVRAAVAALQCVGELSAPPDMQWSQGMDLMDWLGAFFGFQRDNVKNQREHLVLLLANYQMRLQPPPDPINKMSATGVQQIRKKILHNYRKWCSFLSMKNNLKLPKAKQIIDERRELLYTALYLLVWGEAANLRFMPECLCFIFHNMAGELNRILGNYKDESGQKARPAYTGENAFLKNVVTPIYDTVRAEAEASRDGKAPHTAWRNYDDLNEYFWSKRCFTQLRWPLNTASNYLAEPGVRKKQRVGKTGFVEQRSFWNIYRSFDHLWTGYILMLQAMSIVAFSGDGLLWNQLPRRDVQATILSIFISWAGLRVVSAVLEAGMQYSLVSGETKLICLRMGLKVLVASAWSLIFAILFARLWSQRHADRRWSSEANLRLVQFLEAAGVFVLPEVLALVLFVLPWVRNFVERSEWRAFHAMTWWFQSRVFVARGLREDIIDNVKYTTFWLSVLLCKFAFSYFLQIRPMVKPTRQILRLRDVEYTWHEFFKGDNKTVLVVIWAPVVLIYFMDTQIWYSVMAALVGGLLGLFSHLGEIRNVQQFGLRFPFFASAVQFNLMPEESLLKPHDWRKLSAIARDMWSRFKLRYGVGAPMKMLEHHSAEAGKFAHVWNEIIGIFREEDLLSDREVVLLEIPTPAWDIGVFQWPSVLLSNEVLLAVTQAAEWEGDDARLWARIGKSEYRRCAVVECYDSIKHLLGRILRGGSWEREIVERVFAEMDGALEGGSFTGTYRMRELPEVHARMVALVDAVGRGTGPKVEKEEQQQRVVGALQNLYEVVIRDFPTQKRRLGSLRAVGLASGSAEQLLFVDAVELPDPNDEAFFRQLKRFSTTLNTHEPMSRVPRNAEARRRIAFFSNSLFMNMPHAPSVEKMLAFSVLTPYYSEDVLYSKEQLRSENEDGVSILFYLQRIYPDDWNNFLERMARSEGVQEPEELWDLDKARQLRLWASYRGQTLARTVRGMMYYHRALQMLAYLDSASEMEIQQGRELLAANSFREHGPNGGLASEDDEQFSSARSHRSYSSTGSGISVLYRKSQERATALMKFTYVVTCQIYGAQRARREARAEDIQYLMKNNEALRVAYVDEVQVGREGRKYYSVLVKHDRGQDREVEIYRIQLPGPVKLGEGKPENQNHALIFTRGDAVQTIDMNQDNYFEEALKMRNLLQEFTRRYGLRHPQILGVREHVFTGSVSSLAWFMSAQETSFVTLGQRVLANPLKIRMHYGHPDVFDRLWFIPRGGVSKASRVINISEDIFAGFNCTLRGGNVTHHEYIQAGKGRDVGLNQIALFEAKVASGNGEQLLSRDVYRLGHRLDFFRMLSFYYTTVGFFINNLAVVLTVYAFLWGRAYLALSGVERSIANSKSALSNGAIAAALNQQFVIQIGLLTALPMLVENSIERGFSSAIWDFCTMQLQLASVFFTFSMGTRAHYFGRTLLHGGAKYRATGRGFVVRHERFAENYRLYARSHFVKGVELISLLIIYEAYGAIAKTTVVYILLTLSSWFLSLSWIMAPFVFNPSGFDWLKTVDDFDDFMNWLFYKGGLLAKADQSWEVWWYEEQDHLRTTGFWGKLLEIVLSFRFFFFQYGMVYHLRIANNNQSILVYLLSWIYIVVALVIYIIVSRAAEKYSAKQHIYYRAIQAFVTLFVVLVIVMLLELTSFEFLDILISLLAFIPTGWGIVAIALVFRPLLELTNVWPTIVAIARLYELGVAIVVLIPLALFSWLPGFQAMQTRMLFNEAFSRGLQISRILAGKRPNPGF